MTMQQPTFDATGEEPASVASQPVQTAHRAGVSCARHQFGTFSVVEVAGEVDLDAAPLLRGVLSAVATPYVVVDLSRVSFLDSSGLGVLVDARRTAHASGGWLRLVAPQSPVLKVLRVTQADRVMSVHPDLQHAIGVD